MLCDEAVWWQACSPHQRKQTHPCLSAHQINLSINHVSQSLCSCSSRVHLCVCRMSHAFVFWEALRTYTCAAHQAAHSCQFVMAHAAQGCTTACCCRIQEPKPCCSISTRAELSCHATQQTEKTGQMMYLLTRNWVRAMKARSTATMNTGASAAPSAVAATACTMYPAESSKDME